jgi:hypothetical protein
MVACACHLIYIGCVNGRIIVVQACLGKKCGTAKKINKTKRAKGLALVIDHLLCKPLP